MIVRSWRGETKPGCELDYSRHLTVKLLPQLRKLSGFVKLEILQSERASGHEFLILSYWKEMRNIEAFAGDDVTVAVVPVEAQRYLQHYDDEVTHYELVE